MYAVRRQGAQCGGFLRQLRGGRHPGSEGRRQQRARQGRRMGESRVEHNRNAGRTGFRTGPHLYVTRLCHGFDQGAGGKPRHQPTEEIQRLYASGRFHQHEPDTRNGRGTRHGGTCPAVGEGAGIPVAQERGSLSGYVPLHPPER